MINIDNPCQLFVVIDWMMRLPKALEQELWSDIETLEEIDKMRYVTSVERIGMEKGLTKGMELGIQTAEQKTLQRQIQRRFKTLPDWAAERITQASSPQLEQWLDNILDAPSIEAIFTETDSN